MVATPEAVAAPPTNPEHVKLLASFDETIGGIRDVLASGLIDLDNRVRNLEETVSPTKPAIATDPTPDPASAPAASPAPAAIPPAIIPHFAPPSTIPVNPADLAKVLGDFETRIHALESHAASIVQKAKEHSWL